MTNKTKQKDAFVKVPIWWGVEVAKATHSPGMLVAVELLYRSWKAKSLTFLFPNGSLKKHGVSRKTKHWKLRALEAAGLIAVERRHGKTPLVTLVIL
jgi:hypothetical protein